jgi:hypothetical protein
MRKPEQRFWDTIRRNTDKAIYIERIENSAGDGTPDTIALHRGLVSWLELKTGNVPVRAETRVQWRTPLTVPQRNWHLTWKQNGGISYILARVGMSNYLIPGADAERINDINVKLLSPFRLDWEELNRVLMRGCR